MKKQSLALVVLAIGVATTAFANPSPSPAPASAPVKKGEPKAAPGNKAAPSKKGAAPAAPAAAAAKAQEFELDGIHSRVGFEVKHLTVTDVPGSFKVFEGTFIFNPNNVMETMITAKADAKSISTDNDKRDDHLRGPDFFDVEKFPELTLKSKKVVKKNDKNFTLITDMTIKGITKEVPFDVTYNGMAAGKVGFMAKAVINRQDFGLKFTKIMDSLPVVGDKVTIVIHAQGKPKAPAAEAPKAEAPKAEAPKSPAPKK